jgi:hypothetical protein
VAAFVFIDPANPDSPILAKTLLADSLGSVKWSDRIAEVIAEWGVIVKYLVSDNANDMLKTARLAALTHIPCLSHIGQLLYKAIMSAFEIPSFISQIHALYSRSKPRARLFRRARVSPSLFDCPAHRFGTHAKALAFLATPAGWAATRGAVRGVRQSIDDSDNPALPRALLTVQEHLESPHTRAAVAVAHDMLHPLSVLIAESEAHVTPADLASRLTAFIDRIARIHGETEAYIDEVSCMRHWAGDCSCCCGSVSAGWGEGLGLSRFQFVASCFAGFRRMPGA